MRILFVLEHFYPYIGGAEKLFYVLSENLVKEGFKVTVLTTRFDKNLPEKEIHKGIEIIRINCQNRFSFTFFSLPKIVKLAKDCDFIHTTTYNAALPAFLGGKLSGKPIFVTFHEVWGDLWKRLPFTSFLEKNAFYLFEKLLLKLPFDKFIAVSEFTKSKLIEHGISASKIERIYNGIEYEKFANYSLIPPNNFTFTYFGRLGISKGLNLLIPAAAEFRKTHSDSTFKLIIPQHPKPFFDKIQDLIRQYNLSDYIEMHHNLPRKMLYQELLNSSCVVIPSYSEGFCFAAAETVALGVPIISSQQGALKEVVSDQFIEMEAMSSAALTEALKKAYHQDWTEKTIQKYSLQDSINEYNNFYNSLKINEIHPLFI